MEADKRQIKTGHLKKQLDLAEKAAAVLNFSYNSTGHLFPLPEDISDEELVHLDAVTSRFARLVDILTQKVFRAIDSVELTDEGSLIDRLNRAEGRGIIESAEEWRNIRELRNQIAHEYVLDDLHSLFEDVIQFTPPVLKCIDNIKVYLKNVIF